MPGRLVCVSQVWGTFALCEYEASAESAQCRPLTQAA
jgi:hypothetical protein